ncbi:MAG: hypothetical protein ACT4TC_26940 [Myxococcaceae bacterium]
MSFTVDTRRFTQDNALECAPSTIRGPDSVHRLTLTQAQDVSVRALPSPGASALADPAIALRAGAGATCDQGALLGCSGSSESGVEKLDFANLAPGDYSLFVESANEQPGPIDVTVTMKAPTLPPSNDTCANAQVLTFDSTGRATVQGSTFGATNSTAVEDQTPSCNPNARSAGADTVYRYTLSSPQDVQIDLLPAPDLGAVVHVRRVACDSATLGNQVACAGNGAAGERHVRLPNQPAGTYWLFVDTGSAVGGAYSLQLTLSTPTNDDCSVAAPLLFINGSAHAAGNTALASNSNASSDGGTSRSPDCSSTARNSASDLVYTYQLSERRDVEVTVAASDSGFQPAVYVRQQNACGSDDPAELRVCSVTSDATAANTFTLYAQEPGAYSLWVDGAGALPGAFTLDVTLSGPTALPANDTCAAPSLIAFGADGGTQVFEVDTRVAQSQYKGSCNTGRVNSNELVYRISLAVPQDLKVEAKDALDSGRVDPVVYLRGAVCETSPELGCKDSNRGTPDVLNLRNLAAGDYHLFVEAFGTQGAGPTRVTVTASTPTP